MKSIAGEPFTMSEPKTSFEALEMGILTFVLLSLAFALPTIRSAAHAAIIGGHCHF